MNTTSHVAAPLMQVGNRLIQRCCICGIKLYDSEDTKDFFLEYHLDDPNRGEEDRPQYHWLPGVMVREYHASGKLVAMPALRQGRMADFCSALVENNNASEL